MSRGVKFFVAGICALVMTALVCDMQGFDASWSGASSALAGTRFLANGDGTATDAESGLVWQIAAPAETFTWRAAREYCDGLSRTGNTWRLPSREELESLLGRQRADDCRLASGLEGPCGYYWASDMEPGGDGAGFTDMSFGGSGFDARDREHHVRCVRNR